MQKSSWMQIFEKKEEEEIVINFVQQRWNMY